MALKGKVQILKDEIVVIVTCLTSRLQKFWSSYGYNHKTRYMIGAQPNKSLVYKLTFQIRIGTAEQPIDQGGDPVIKI